MNNVMRSKYVFIVFISILFFQCKTTQLRKFENAVRKSTSINFLNLQEFNRSRELMLNTFSPDVIENDSVIILEYFADGIHGYYCTIYESKGSLRHYSAARNIKRKGGSIYVDSLKTSDVKDRILPMIINGELNDVIKKGGGATLTPAALLIINILTKNENKTGFDTKTVVTQKFSP